MQAKFFRSLIAGYVNGDPRIEEFILEQGNLSAAKKDKVHRNLQEGRDIVTNLGLSEDQIEDLFDVIAGEHPDLWKKMAYLNAAGLVCLQIKAVKKHRVDFL